MVRGSHKLINEELILRTMSEYFYNNPVGILVRGNDNNGVDAYVSRLSQNYNYQVRLYFANWGLFGLSADYIRDKTMINNERPDILFAFPTKKSKSVRNTIRYARKKGIKVITCELN